MIFKVHLIHAHAYLKFIITYVGPIRSSPKEKLLPHIDGAHIVGGSRPDLRSQF
jgi:hypothetical protein